MLMVSNATKRSMKIKTNKFPLDFAIRMLLMALAKALSVKWLGLTPDEAS